ncbi:MAG: hypothetical protein F4144_15475 [Acidimicrobiaceae bacterium]|nr:hypothetical protein [Acidimicrobiaceae bacterium]
MPVSSGPRPDLRTVVVVGLAGVVVALGLVLGVLLLTRGGTDVEIRLGDRDFRDMETGRISAEIADRGPILFGDVADGERDIILQHLGDDPESGWLAFEARRPGQSRDCFFEWQAGQAEFVNTCDPDDVVDAAGTGLRHFSVAVVDGDVRVDINPEAERTNRDP